MNFRSEISHLIDVIADKGRQFLDLGNECELLKEMLKAEKSKRAEQRN